MNIRKLLPALLVVVSLLIANTPVRACTGGALIAKDGGVAVGRTLEFGQPLDSVLAIWPAGSEFTGTTPTGANGLKWKSKYGLLGPTVATFHDQLFDGINDQGLNAGIFYFPGFAEYAEATPENTAKGISPGQIVTWILSNCATVAEVKEKINDVAMLGGVLELERTRLAICEMLEGVREDYSALAGVKNVALRWHCPRNLYVVGDKDAVLQILHNLLDNALRYAKSEVALAAGADEGGRRIRVEITNDRREVSASERGTGLGLRLTEALVKRMPGWDFKSSEEANLYRAVLTTPAA